MSEKTKYVVLPKEQKEVADQIIRNFQIVLILAVVGETLLRLSPLVLKDAEERVWLEWLLVSLIGVCAYLLWNAAIWHKRQQADFIAFRPWYRATAARGPVIALVVLVALTNINFRVSLPVTQGSSGEETTIVDEGDQEAATQSPFDFGINFGQASNSVLLIAAFVLGFYSRLANDVLGHIARFIFKGVYEETYKQEIGKDAKENQVPKEGDDKG